MRDSHNTDSHNPEISRGEGLTQAEAEARLHTYGRNELEEPPRRRWRSASSTSSVIR